MDKNAPEIVDKKLADHREAVRVIRAELDKVPDIGIGCAGTLAGVVNALRVATYNDPRSLTASEKATLLTSLSAVHVALMALKLDPHQAVSITSGLNVMGTLVLAWSGDPRWTRGGGAFLTVQKFALSWQLELLSTAIIDDIAAEQTRLEAGRAQVVERLLTAGALEN
jgi:hypothetical protein